MNQLDVLDKYRQRISEALQRYWAAAQPLAGQRLTVPEKQALNYLKEFSLRPAKRIRGSLTLFAYERLSKKDNPSIINAALAVELVQNYFLIIDDVMDRSETRRGGPSVHWQIMKDAKTSEHLANMLAVTVGLMASHLAQLKLLEVDEKAQNLIEASRILQDNILVTAYGQIDDLYNQLGRDSKEAEIITMYERKNSYYSIINPLAVGAALAGKYDAKTLSQIEKIGRPAGVAFQIQDDILGMFGQEEVTGKSANDDLREGKLTLLMLYTLERASSEQAALVRRVLGNQTASASEIERVKDIVKTSGALEAAAKKANDYAGQSKKELASATIFDSQAKEFLSNIIGFLVSRKV